jgi:predicted dehydrogenase
VCDIREEAVTKAVTKYGIPEGETDYRKVLADPEIDAVAIVTQAEQHEELCVAALEAGKHVFVEKPLAETTDQGLRIVEAQERSGKHLAVGFNRRFAPAYRKAKELVDAHGGAFNLYYRISDWYCFTWGRRFPPRVRIHHEVCHVFDILRWMTSSEIVSVFCMESRADDEQIMCKFSSGAVATILSSGYTPVIPKEYLEVVTKEGALTVENFVELWTHSLPEAERRYRFKGHFHPDREWTQRYFYEQFGSEAMRIINEMSARAWRTSQGEPIDTGSAAEDRLLDEFYRDRIASGYDVDKGWLQSMDHFAECIASGRKPENADAYDGMIAERIADGVIESRKTGNLVEIG